MDWGVKRGSPSYGLGERYTNSARRRLGRVRTALRAASFTGFPSALLGGQSKRVARELETSEKGEGVGEGGGGYGRIAGHFTPHTLGGHFVTELP